MEAKKQGKKSPQKYPDFGSQLPHFLIIPGSKRACCPIFNHKKRS